MPGTTDMADCGLRRRSMPELTASELADRSFDGDARPLVLDIRRADDFEDWHVPGSTHVDVYDDLQDDPAAAKAALSGLPADREIVTVCAAGVVSEVATTLLTEMGYDAKTLVDGMAGWSRLHRSAPVDADLDGTLVQVARPGKGCLSYLLVSDGEAAVFDPSHYPGEYEERLADRDADLVCVFDTHAHADHVSGGPALSDRHDVPYYLHPADAGDLDATPVEDGSTIAVGAVEVSVVHTPGHSPGGVTYDVGGEALLTGDTLFHERVGRVELGVEAGIEDTGVEENAAALYHSLARVRRRPGNPLVLPAHDPGSPEPPVAARLRAVERQNDDLRRDREAFVEALSADVPAHPPNFRRVKRANLGLTSIPEAERSALELGPNRCAAE